MSPILKTFLGSGVHNNASQQQTRAMLDECRSMIFALIDPSNETPIKAGLPLTRPAGRSASPQKPQAAPTASVIPRASTPGAITAASFQASTAKPTMTRSEFEKLSHSDRAAFMKSGKLQDDPKPAKPQTDRAGNLTRDGFRNLAPAKQSAYIKNGGKLVD